ncbi:transmembrane protease serine 12 isoform X2 [Drosophila biarmipes]|uniref:transmembrane protease serine 12 isoform X2 n=1 Tax=Drosophila biarmipes TaxID=125945 RepID=UPI0021CCF0EE|nr:transmembrane protease serine 12 isoform X2 [Drosophila biarmipes]
MDGLSTHNRIDIRLRGNSYHSKVARLGEFMEADSENYAILSEHQVNQTFVHPLYNMKTHDNDIAILGLETDVKYSDHIKPICITWWTTWRWYIDTIPVLTGAIWGLPMVKNESDAFRTEDIRRQPAEICTSENGTSISSSQFCAGDSESKLCHVDSSSPLGAMISYRNYSRFVLIGIATTNQRCNRPSIYTDVLSHIEFILWVWRHYGNTKEPPYSRDLSGKLKQEENDTNLDSHLKD